MHYTLKINTLSVTYDVKNLGDTPMYFSVGGHPAFKLPLWCGIADSVNTTQQLIEKEGINALEGWASFEKTWSVELL